MEWSIQDLSKAAGTTSRTLRHYGDLGLLEPTRLGANGYRYYDQSSLLRLQRILVLRELGVSLGAIAEILQGQEDPVDALRGHLKDLTRDQERLRRQIASVTSTIGKLERGEQLMAQETFDGFDQTQYKDEVIERWGKDYFIGLGQMYADDPRFGKNYDQHAEGGAAYVRDAMKVYADRNLA